MKNLFIRLLASLFAALFLFFPLTVQAEDIEIRFEADIDKTSPYYEGQLECLGEAFGEVEILTGRYTYDSEVVGVSPTSQELVFYNQDTAKYGFRVEVGDDIFQSVTEVPLDPENTNYWISVYHRDPSSDLSDSITIGAHNIESSVEDLNAYFIYIVFSGDSGILTSMDLPKVPPDELGEWTIHNIHIEGYCPDHFVLKADISEMERVYPMDDLDEMLVGLLENADLNEALEFGMYRRFTSALAKFARDMDFQACQQFQAFMCQLEALLPMFDEENEELAEDALELADEIFGEECKEFEIMECSMGE